MEIKVACLYRVSTKAQLTDNDIPLQRNACRAFADRQPGWKIVAEYSEQGVSGYHIAAAERDALNKIKQEASEGRYEILLVYMFDRLGRREDETPLVAEWLYENGVTVWSVVEGAQRFNGHVDRLLNYVQYWQSGSESGNTALRVAEKHRQLTVEGKYRGGTPPYGYRLIPSGDYNRKGHERMKLVINETEALMVRRMYQYAYEHKIGSYTLAKYLNEQPIVTRSGRCWTSPAVVRILRNPIYKGDYISGRTIGKRGNRIRQSREQWVHSREIQAALAIIDAKIWDAVNADMDKRRHPSSEQPNKETDKIQQQQTITPLSNHKKTQVEYPIPAESPAPITLQGWAYCGRCGAKLSLNAGKRYDCPRRMRLDRCDGAFGHGAIKVERIVWSEMTLLLCMATASSFTTRVADDHVALLKQLHKKRIGLLRKKKAQMANATRYIVKNLMKSDEEAVAYSTTKTLTSYISEAKKISENYLNKTKEASITCLNGMKEASATYVNDAAQALAANINETEQALADIEETIKKLKTKSCPISKDKYELFLRALPISATITATDCQRILAAVCERVELNRNKLIIRLKINLFG